MEQPGAGLETYRAYGNPSEDERKEGNHLDEIFYKGQSNCDFQEEKVVENLTEKLYHVRR